MHCFGAGAILPHQDPGVNLYFKLNKYLQLAEIDATITYLKQKQEIKL